MCLKHKIDINEMSAGFTAMNESKQTLEQGKLTTYPDDRRSKFLSDICTYLSNYTASHTRREERAFIVTAVRTSSLTRIILLKQLLYIYQKRWKVLLEEGGQKYRRTIL
jgi:hypothetical protein